MYRLDHSVDWVEPDYEISQLLIGHGCFRKRLNQLGLNDSRVWLCGHTDEDMHYVLWSCPLYDTSRNVMLNGTNMTNVDCAAGRNEESKIEEELLGDEDCCRVTSPIKGEFKMDNMKIIWA
ncbi:Retrovirus-related Pol polyprotein from type-1 retrotransposable element R1 4 [Eumeta japonica]|uniref:Retrovirus-related Pol polyprotein from type-1 retrotransposable element R1 4 n=1 Tax=Eumeta variegata TaxID=151549 RepID=A0A4C1YUS0_EUMVA|nr:Retrovirus-related Pol polyprotein from type-1 retrotransposable element R1 4 [Eumeta japonica]